VLPKRLAHDKLLPGRLPGDSRCHNVTRFLGLARSHGTGNAITYCELLVSRRLADYSSTHSLKPHKVRLNNGILAPLSKSRSLWRVSLTLPVSFGD
jgi:hypothetical protein